MPDNLRISTPIPPQENLNRPSPSAETPLTDVINPSKVTPPNPREQNADGQSADLLLGGNSVFGKFVQLFRQTPALSETLAKVLLDFSARADGDTGDPSRMSPVLQLIQNLPMEKEDMLRQLTLQQEDASRLTSPLFQLLRQISAKTEDPQFDLRLADFLKAFNGFFSAETTTSSIAGNLKNIAEQIPRTFRERLQAVAQKLDTSNSARSVNANLKVIKEEILPLLGEYVSKSSDYGKSREEISMLLHNIATLNISPKEELGRKFQALLEYCRTRLNLPEPTLQKIQSGFADEIRTGNGEKPENAFSASLLSLLSRGSEHDTESIDKNVFRQITRSLLLDNSVYMPFSHYYLPASVMGKFLFSEIWVQKPDPDADSHERKRESASPAPSVVYLTFDIQDLGYFEACFTLQGKKTDFSLSCPVALRKKSGEIQSGVTQILKKSGLEPGEIRVSSGEAPKVPGRILKKIYERTHTINVTV